MFSQNNVGTHVHCANAYVDPNCGLNASFSIQKKKKIEIKIEIHNSTIHNCTLCLFFSTQSNVVKDKTFNQTQICF